MEFIGTIIFIVEKTSGISSSKGKEYKGKWYNSVTCWRAEKIAVNNNIDEIRRLEKQLEELKTRKYER